MYHTQKLKTKRKFKKKRHHPSHQCLNCNKFGHYYKDCRHPLNSYGTLIFRYNAKRNEIEYLMICRKHSFGYVECIRVCFDITDACYVKQLLSEMTKCERAKILECTFDELWHDLWQHTAIRHTNDYKQAGYKFSQLRSTALFRNIVQALPESTWFVPEWGFPKGKRNLDESSLHCAFREMEEETNFVQNRDILLLKKNPLVPTCVVEVFQGTDGRCYRHTYYICKPVRKVEPVIVSGNTLQCREVSAIRWMSYAECLQHIRSYNTAKINLIQRIHPKIILYCKEIMNIRHLHNHSTTSVATQCSNNCEESKGV
jgi:8-oxo-dGTP pyrophosphatase MutT (NUDIX family)